MTGIALYKPSKLVNFASIMRLAYNFDVDYVACIAGKYKRGPADTMDAAKQIPTFYYKDFKDFTSSNFLEDNIYIALEITNRSKNLETFCHPKNAVYFFGGESQTLPDDILDHCHYTLKLKTNRCLNLAMCAGMVLFHRHLQFFKN